MENYCNFYPYCTLKQFGRINCMNEETIKNCELCKLSPTESFCLGGVGI